MTGCSGGYFFPITMGLNSKKYEEKADKRAVDYMVKAGYNPVAYITVGNKIFNRERYDIFRPTHWV